MAVQVAPERARMSDPVLLALTWHLQRKALLRQVSGLYEFTGHWYRAKHPSARRVIQRVNRLTDLIDLAIRAARGGAA